MRLRNSIDSTSSVQVDVFATDLHRTAGGEIELGAIDEDRAIGLHDQRGFADLDFQFIARAD